MKVILICAALAWAFAAVVMAVRRAHVAGYALNDWSSSGPILRKALVRVVVMNAVVADVLGVLAVCVAVGAGFLLGRP